MAENCLSAALLTGQEQISTQKSLSWLFHKRVYLPVPGAHIVPAHPGTWSERPSARTGQGKTGVCGRVSHSQNPAVRGCSPPTSSPLLHNTHSLHLHPLDSVSGHHHPHKQQSKHRHTPTISVPLVLWKTNSVNNTYKVGQSVTRV